MKGGNRSILGFLVWIFLVWPLVALGEKAETKTFVAYSMRMAQERVEAATEAGEDFRKKQPDLYYLGGITKPWAVVLDANDSDWILVGERDPKCSILTLDDWVVALRARFIYADKDPGVTIDPRPCELCIKAGKKEACSHRTKQDVRFFGGIENTHFGQVCFEADWLMKKMGLGLEKLPIEKLKTYYDLSVEQHRNSGANTSNVGSRFWFYPIVNRVNVLDDIVLLEKFQMGVFTEVLYAEVDGKPVSNVDKFEHYPSEGFARSFSEEYDAAAEKREVLETLRGLTRLAALAKGLPYVDQLPKVEFWLTVYKSESLKTCTNVEVLKAEDRGVGFVITGGVEMKALATRLNGGNVHVVSELVLHTRPKLTALTWTFELVSREGQIVGVLFPASRADSAQVAPLLMQAIFLENKKHYDAAIEAYTAVITLDPETVEAYNGRGTALEYKHEYDRAIDDYTKALAINPRYALAYSNRGNVYDYKGSYNNAILDYTKALQIDPSLAGAYYNRGVAHHQKGRYQEAIADFNHALDLKWSPDRVYFYRGLSFLEVRDYDKALADFTAAIESNPTFSEAYTSRAAIFAQQRQEYDRAIADCDHALQFTPELVVETYCIRGFAYENKLDLKAALGDYTKAIELKQTYAPAYMGRGWVWALTAQNDMAISDLSKAIELDPKLALAYSRRGAVYGDMGKYDKAKDDLERAILLDPDGPAGLTAKPVLKYLREKGAIKE